MSWADDDDDLVPIAHRPRDVVSHGLYPFGVGHGGPSELLDYERHRLVPAGAQSLPSGSAACDCGRITSARIRQGSTDDPLRVAWVRGPWDGD